jgi:glycyl-tRNA synthetase beta subunit
MNILAAEEKKSKTNFTAGFSDTLVAPAEKALVAALKVAPQSPADLDALAAPINQFFTDHLVTEEGFREARLSLLAAVRDAANTIADFSKIEG